MGDHQKDQPLSFCKSLQILMLAAVWAGQGRADQVQLVNGDCLSGQVKSIAEGRLKLVSPILGALDLDIKQVATVRTEESGPIVLKDFEYKEGRLAPGPEKLEIRRGEEPVEAVALADILAFREGVAALAGERRIQWSNSVEMGVLGHSGNTDQVKVNALYNVEGKNEDWLIKYFATGAYGREKRENQAFETDNKGRTGGHLERNLRKHLSTYGAGEMERDRIKELEFRGMYNGGLGFPLVRQKELFYELRTGLGQQFEETEEDGRSSSAIGNLGSEFKYILSQRLELSQLTNWIPRLDAPDYRITADSAATVYLNERKNLYLKSGVRNEFDSTPARGVEQYDIYYFTNLGYKF